MRLLAFAASLRTGSFNRLLLRPAVEAARAAGVAVDHADFREFEMPLYDGDLQARDGLPPGALELQRRVEAVDGLILATPEYNHSIPGTLKNAIDWVSRARPMPWKGKSILVLSASPGPMGGARSTTALRGPLAAVGMFAHPSVFNLARANAAFDPEGNFVDPANGERLAKLVAEFLPFAEALAKRS